MKTIMIVVLAGCAVFPAAGQQVSGANPAARGANYHRMKMVRIVDERGFERPMTALTLLIPTDWQFQGSAQYATAVGCHANLVRLVFRATSPDGRIAIEMFPGNVWQWADDRNAVGMMQAQNQQRAQFGAVGCDIAPPLTAEQFLRQYVIPRVRPGVQAGGVEPMPDVREELEQQVRRIEQRAAQQGMRLRLRGDVTRLRLSYTVNSQPAEEWMTAMTFATAMAGPSFNMYTGAGQTTYYNCGGDHIFGLRAPRGQLEAQEKFFRMVLATIRVDSQWQARVAQAIANLQATDARGARERSAIIAQSGRDIADIIHDTNQNTNRSRDRAMEGWSQYMRGVETYRNPSTGDTVELSNQYGHAWAGGNGEYVVSDSANFDPNVTLRGNWTRLEAVRR